MLSKNDIQLIRSLAIKKYRQKYHKYLAEGEKMGLEILKYVPDEIEALFCTADFYESYKNEILASAVVANIVTEKELAKISLLKTPNRVLMIMKMQERDKFSDSEKSKKVIYLDNVRDPGNLGTIIRSAEWFGMDLLLLSPNCVDPYNPKVIQASMGSIFRLRLMISALEEFLSLCPNDFSIYSAEMKGISMYKTEFKLPLILVMGNESAGVGEDLQAIKHTAVHIPGKSEITESLNVAIAAAVLMAEIQKTN